VSERGSFWTTLPGILTGIAMVITAVGGLIGGLYGTGVIGNDTTDDVEKAKLTLTISSGEGGRTIPEPGIYHYNRDEQVTITASADPGWEFYEWRGDYSGKSDSVKLTIVSDMSVTAYFVKGKYSLTSQVDEGGWISPSNGTYDAGTKVKLTAMADPGWEFDHWSSTDEDYINPTWATMDSDKRVVAYFKRIEATLIYEWRAVAVDPPWIFFDDRMRKVVCLALSEESISEMASSYFGRDIELRPKEELAEGVFNLEQATQLLWESGYPDGFLMTAAAVPNSDEILMFLAQAMIEQLGDVNIEVRLVFEKSGQEDMVIERIQE